MATAHHAARILPLLTVQEVCELLRVSKATVTRLAQSKELSSVRVGKRLLFDTRDIEAFIEAHKQNQWMRRTRGQAI
jgi:excisionase family DNA binding protein